MQSLSSHTLDSNSDFLVWILQAWIPRRYAGLCFQKKNLIIVQSSPPTCIIPNCGKPLGTGRTTKKICLSSTLRKRNGRSSRWTVLATASSSTRVIEVIRSCQFVWRSLVSSTGTRRVARWPAWREWEGLCRMIRMCFVCLRRSEFRSGILSSSFS